MKKVSFKYELQLLKRKIDRSNDLFITYKIKSERKSGCYNSEIVAYFVAKT